MYIVIGRSLVTDGSFTGPFIPFYLYVNNHTFVGPRCPNHENFIGETKS